MVHLIQNIRKVECIEAYHLQHSDIIADRGVWLNVYQQFSPISTIGLSSVEISDKIENKQRHFHHQTHHVPVKEAATWCQKVLLQGNNRHRLPVPDWFIRKALPRHTKRRDFSVRSQRTGRCYRHSNPDLPYSDACHIRLESFLCNIYKV